MEKCNWLSGAPSANTPDTDTKQETAFSFEVLPPLRGKSIDTVYRTIDRLMPFSPVSVNITTHRAETIYSEQSDGRFERLHVQGRPGTVAIAAAIKGRYGIKTVPHIICSGFTTAETEAELIDLSYLGISNLLLLRGDRPRGENKFTPMPGGHSHAIELCRQVNDFNNGKLLGDVRCEALSTPFTYGVAGYPEKHEEAMNLETDIENVVRKVEAGASYIVTQMFFDNSKYFDFVQRLRNAGVTVPVIPGIKPLTTLGHRSLLPKTFHIDFPDDLAKELERCQTNDDVKQVGTEWGIHQCLELKNAHVPCIHFYSMNAATLVENIAKAVF